MIVVYIAYVICAYLLGSFPYMLILSRAKGYDLSNEPDVHAALFQKVGKGAGISGFLVDFLKGVIAVLVAQLLGFPLIVTAAAAVVVVMGQMWPVFQRFDGEKGNTTGAGATIFFAAFNGAGLAPLIGVIIVAIGFGIRTIPRFISRGQSWDEKLKLGGPASNSLPVSVLIGYASMPITSLLLGSAWELTAALALIFVVIVIRRLTAGVRHDVKQKKSTVKKILFNRFLFDRSYYRAAE
jgi:acyl phosphate:glycerol-3-phosphate acyltransferase